MARCRDSLTITREIGHHIGAGEALNYLGYVYHAAGDYAQAAQLHGESIAVLETTGGLEPLSLALLDLAETQLMRGALGEVIQLAQRAAQIGQDHGYRLLLAAAYWVQARAADGQGKLSQALDLAQQALDIYTALEHPKADEIRSKMEVWHC